jgi:dinuclear metal center YbgI/SA1388 family protein
MIECKKLVQYCDELLDSAGFQDYCPNGLQVEGKAGIKRLVAGVTASQALVDAAVSEAADALLVHHGYFWKGEDPVITGIKQRRIKSLLDAGINLLAYHLPLDAHPEFGNNARLGQLLGIVPEGSFGPPGGPEIGLFGELEHPLPAADFLRQLGEALQREPQYIEGHNRPIQRVGWCTGAAQGYIEAAAAYGLDAYISGEISEQTVHQARELGIDYIAAGHHATERYGAEALGRHLADKFGLEYTFIDIDNPV